MWTVLDHKKYSEFFIAVGIFMFICIILTFGEKKNYYRKKMEAIRNPLL